MAKDNRDRKARSSYNWFVTNGDWDEDEISQRTQIFSLKSLVSKKATEYCSSLMIPTMRRKADILKAWESFSIIVKASSGEIA